MNDLLFFCLAHRFLEAEYKACLEYPVGVLGPQKASVKKSPEGWLKYNEQTDDWETLRDGVEISSKKPTQSAIAQIPSAGYTQRDNFSKVSIQWLEYLMVLAQREGKPVRIDHALNGGEVPILGTHYKVDGKCGTTVYEFHGKIVVSLYYI